LCSLCALFVLSLCSLCALFVLSLCSLCSLCALFVLSLCSLCALFVLFLCSFCVLPFALGIKNLTLALSGVLMVTFKTLDSFMGGELDKLRQPMKLEVKNGNSDFVLGDKKRYFRQNIDIIFDLVENYDIKYSQIIDAMSREGIDFTYSYFRQLMCKEKKKRQAQWRSKKELPIKETHAIMDTSESLEKEKSVDENKATTEISAKKAAFIAENERIKNLNISFNERRALIKKATDEYLMYENPLK